MHLHATNGVRAGILGGMKSAVRGFTLIEMMMVVALMGIGATIAITEYSKATARAKRTEAITALANIRDAQIAFRVKKDRYANDFDELGWEVKGGTSPDASTRVGDRYRYQLTVNEAGYCATAFGNIDGDPWIDIVVIGDGCGS